MNTKDQAYADAVRHHADRLRRMSTEALRQMPAFAEARCELKPDWPAVNVYREELTDHRTLIVAQAKREIFFGYGGLSIADRRRVDLWLIGILAATATGFAVHFVYSTARMAAFLLDAGGFWLVLIAALFPCIILSSSHSLNSSEEKLRPFRRLSRARLAV